MSAEQLPKFEPLGGLSEVTPHQSRFLKMYDGLERWHDDMCRAWNESAVVEAWDNSRWRTRWHELEDNHATARLIGAVPDLIRAAFFSGDR